MKSVNSELFQLMFPAIAKFFACSEKKTTYLVNHGLAPYIENSLLDKVKNSGFVLLFDESLTILMFNCFRKDLKEKKVELLYCQQSQGCKCIQDSVSYFFYYQMCSYSYY